MASGRLAAVELNKNISQSIYVCPTDDVTTVTLNVVNRRNDEVIVSVALTDDLNTDITSLTDTTIYPLELEVPIPPKGVMERTQIVVPSGKYLTLLSNEDFVTATAWGVEVGNTADPAPTPVTTNLGPTPTINTSSITVLAGFAYANTLNVDYESGGLLTYTVTSGTLPAGIELSETGVIQGTPTGVDEEVTVTIEATTNTGVTATKNITFKKMTITGGDTVYTHKENGVEYIVHAFLEGTKDFITSADIDADVLVVAGGGGGGSHVPGGGGAGGLIYRPLLPITAGTYSTVVGEGGAKSDNRGSYPGMPNATAGGDSSFGALLTALGGGHGGSWTQDTRSNNGGSGGGRNLDRNSGQRLGLQPDEAGDSGTYGYGNDGAISSDNNATPYGGGGGGGAGAPGESPSSRDVAGAGGDGMYMGTYYGDTYGEDGWFAGGGGGGAWGNVGLANIGAGGRGGGGSGDAPNGSASSGNGNSLRFGGSGEPTGESGMPNTGGGGGGAGRTGGSSSKGGDGGSGIVLVRYQKFAPKLPPNPIPLYNPLDPVPANSFFGQRVATSGSYVAVTFRDASSDTRISIYSTDGSFLREITAPAAGEFASRMRSYGTYLFTSITDEKALVYDMSTGNNVLELDNPNPAGTTSFDFYGRGLSMDDNYIVVGAPSEDVGGSSFGSVYVYDRSNGDLLYRKDGTVAGSFGGYTAIAGDYLVISAWSQPIPPDNFSNGEVYVYNIADGSPVRTMNTVDTDATPGDKFGISLAANSSYIVVGASGADDDGSGSGRVYVYDTTTGNLLHTLVNPNRLGTVNNDQFGSTLSLNGDLLAVGSADGGITSGGTVYLFDLSGATVTVREIANPDLLDTGDQDYFGFEADSVSLSSTHLVIGAPRAESAGGTRDGNAFIYNLQRVLDEFEATDV